MSSLPADNESLSFASNLLEWVPPTFQHAPKFSYSTGTREPKFFDKHLEERLTLKRITVSPQLPQVCKEFALDYLKKLDPNERTLFQATSQRRFKWISPRERERLVANERDIEEGFTKEIGSLASAVASYLTFRHWDMLKIRDPHPAAYANTGAKGRGDKYLDFVDPIPRGGHNLNDEDLKQLTKQVEGRAFMMYEFKSLLAGGQPVFEAILSLAGQFKWTWCGGSSCGSQHWIGNRFAITGAPTGPDTRIAKYKRFKGDGTEVGDDGPSVQQPNQESSPPSKSGQNERVRATRTAETVINRIQRRNQERANRHKAKFMLQQVWAAAVAADLTVICISSGNNELLCIRRRSSQELLVSPVLNTSDQGYILTHIGALILALLDTRHRAKLVSKGRSAFKDLLYYLPRASGTRAEPLAGIMIWHKLQRRFQAGITKVVVEVVDDRVFYPSTEKVLTFIKSGSSRMVGEQPCITIQLANSPMGGSTSVYEGRVIVPGWYQSYRVVVMVGLCTVGAEKVEWDYEAFMKLKASLPAGLVPSLGLYRHYVSFASPDMEREYHCIWVMLDGGRSLREVDAIPSDIRSKFECVIQKLHSLDMAHGQISEKNMLYDEIGQCVHFIGWEAKDAKPNELKQVMQRDRNNLKHYLNRHDCRQRESLKRKRDEYSDSED